MPFGQIGGEGVVPMFRKKGFGFVDLRVEQHEEPEAVHEMPKETLSPVEETESHEIAVEEIEQAAQIKRRAPEDSFAQEALEPFVRPGRRRFARQQADAAADEIDHVARRI